MAVIKDTRGLKEKIEKDPSNSGFLHQPQMEAEKQKLLPLENQRRQNNLVTLCVSILKELACIKKLPALFDM
jgi:hypothetical protein